MFGAIMWMCFADIAAVEDESVIDVFPIFFRYEFFEIVGYFLEILIFCEIEF